MSQKNIDKMKQLIEEKKNPEKFGSESKKVGNGFVEKMNKKKKNQGGTRGKKIGQ